ncbi:EscF/YscF/HrpA family type III secretion system needle major subunit [Cupriavidus sp. H18C1]|uniref:EscF/YscF/HrpA family type III secretion system needle major subunit n=1 Tax=Cupriavidus sp. H18C1 TaxID=3241601 RepID=UPI003BB8DDF7
MSVNTNALIDSIDGPVASANFNMAEAVQRAVSTGETTDFILAQKMTAAFTNMTALQSSLIKAVHDMIAGIIQKM